MKGKRCCAFCTVFFINLGQNSNEELYAKCYEEKTEIERKKSNSSSNSESITSIMCNCREGRKKQHQPVNRIKFHMNATIATCCFRQLQTKQSDAFVTLSDY